MTKHMKIEIPDRVTRIISILDKFNHEAFIVGGCVRDKILGVEPKDWDITTSAEPEEIIKIFNDEGFINIPTGLKHGTITVVIEKEHFEITTYRIDGEYKDSRHPSDVKFTKSLKEDLKRRDYTINAMAYNNKVGLVDYFNGRSDIEKKLIRAVGEPKKRLEEDALRMLRAHRFSAQLGFEIDKETMDAIKNLSVNIKNVSIERIREEFNKILLSDNLVQLYELYESGLLQEFFGELASYFETLKKNHINSINTELQLIKNIQIIEKELPLRLAIIFQNIGKMPYAKMNNNVVLNSYDYSSKSEELASRILKKMKYDNKTIEKVLILIRYYLVEINDKITIKKILNKIGVENFQDLIKVKEAKAKVQGIDNLTENMEQIKNIKVYFNEIISSNQCFNIKDLALKGEDIISLGIKPGKIIGEILNELLELVIYNPDMNEKNSLLEKLKDINCIKKNNLLKE